MMEMSSMHMIQGQVTSCPCPVPGCRVHCLSGVLWITQNKTAGDRIIGRGEVYVAQGNGLIVIEAITDAAVIISPPWEETHLYYEGRTYHAST